MLICVAAFAAYRIWSLSGDRPVALRPSAAASAAPASPVTLALTVTGAKCQVFVRVPDGDILVNRNLLRGESVRLDERRLSVVLSDGSAARVWVNGTLRPAGKAGRLTFIALKATSAVSRGGGPGPLLRRPGR